MNDKHRPQFTAEEIALMNEASSGNTLLKTSPALAIAKTLMTGEAPDTRKSHSLGVKTNKPGKIARALLRGEPKPIRPIDENRPLIDLVLEASHHEDPGLWNIEDHRTFRELLRKAKCFTLDADTSAMIGDLSIAVAYDLEVARHMAIPPFPVTWIEFDNVARLNRMKKLGVELTPTAAGETLGPPVPRCGWLIYPDSARGYFANYFTVVGEGVLMAPMAWAWLTGDEAYELPDYTKEPDYQEYMERIAFGMKDCGAIPLTYTIGISRWMKRTQAREVLEYMEELAGELRHIFGFLTTLSAGHAGLTASTSPRPAYQGPSAHMPNGKPIFPLEHKHLKLHLGKNRQVSKVMAQIITRHRSRFHDVRGHMRRLKSGRLVPVKSHTRGDKALGVITKDYIVER